MDKPSFQSIAGEHGDLIERVLRALRVHPNDVPDVAQEVFCAVHRRLPMFPGKGRTTQGERVTTTAALQSNVEG